ncbi:CPBP family intramembrane metalloprotease [Micrococcus lylae]|nr:MULTISPECIES: CPBP family intramembrane glutamic endopeptidase [Micrococcus]MCT2007699.1 CPBP family intramembrane metalloprotease [Micrococcus lylae]MCT2071432.1 CPBP family intramembrane metalloprotease [Micrococcus lylae]PNL18941.1 CPBP family intramembrane metalloprotease [Micrococcus sp. FDAARGOS_333]
MPAPSARTVRWEVAIVLGLSLGKSAVYAVVQLLDKMTQGPLQDQTTVLNPVLNNRWVFDLTYQLLNIGFALVPVALVLHLVRLRGRNPFRAFGLDFRRPWADLGWGSLLFLVMGLGTLAVYAGGRALGATTAIVGSAMDDTWYAVPVLVLSALRHALVEEVIVVAWMVDRLSYLQQLRSCGLAGEQAPLLPAPRTTDTGAFLPVRVTAIVIGLAVLRAGYHLYQGIGPGLGNAAMGVVFVLFYLRWRRVMPLVVAHLLLDVTGFVAAPLLAQLGWFGT